ncbi:MAG: aminotransferase DegT [Alphaproteobacteria bacterium]|nr:MAG: aminotransferase DegT [Alphaproteobacteria bacterium]
MPEENIPVFMPYFTDAEMKISADALELRWLGPGKYVKDFELALASFLEVEPWQVVAVNTGASAVHMALELCDVSAGDEVITPSFNNIADFQMIRAMRAEPVFCDVLEDTLTIDPSKIEALITVKTKAIICLDYGCTLCDFDAVKAIGDKHNIPVIYDAAHSFGSSHSGQKIGSYGDFVTFSFDPVKNITCIDGGAVIVKSKEHAQRIQHMRLLGQQQNQDLLDQNKRGWRYDVDGPGYRYHLANLHGAIGIAQMEKIDDIFKQRKRVFGLYDAALGNVDGMVRPVKNGEDLMPFLYVVRILKGRRQEFQDYLAQHGVDTGIHWQPGHRFSGFKECRAGDLSVTDKIVREIVSLPLYPELSDKNIHYIINVIQRFFKQKVAGE